MARVLLVEDDPMISEIYQRKFSAAGFEVRIAASGKAVLDILRTESFDLVLLDIVLPEMSGMEILEKLRNPKNGYNSDIKIVMFSSLSEKDDRDRAVALGASGFISKTEVSPSELIVEVTRFLHQFEAQASSTDRKGISISNVPNISA
ncbi:MAG: response regulator [Candidatus Moraniibacteriota bacterium]|nr:MAG: response regulator [Candidatus Moranbacteria bacterium]